MNKVFSVWKPVDATSYDVIRKIKSNFNNIKIGHCGTLDPFAEGILIICTGSFTKKTSKYMEFSKTYVADIKIGEETDTLDLTGKVIKKNKTTPKICSLNIINAIKKFTGEIFQTPPYFSAKKIHGVKMYSLARNDIFIRTKPFKVRINYIKLISFDNSVITLKINCNKGTYIRSLARDIAYELGTYGYLSKLKRTSIGDFNKKNSISFKDLDLCTSIN